MVSLEQSWCQLPRGDNCTFRYVKEDRAASAASTEPTIYGSAHQWMLRGEKWGRLSRFG